MTQEREAERGGVFTRRNSLHGDPSTAARSLALESRAAGAERWPPRGDSGEAEFSLRSSAQHLCCDRTGQDGRLRRH